MAKGFKSRAGDSMMKGREGGVRQPGSIRDLKVSF